MIRQTADRTATTAGLGRTIRGVAGVAAAAAGMTFATPKAAEALTIDAHYSANLSASSITVIQNAIAFYQNTFSDPITVHIGFGNMGTGLGESIWYYYNVNYLQYSTALAADATSADDASAAASVPVQATDPLGGTTVVMKSANARAVGININPTAGNLNNNCFGVADQATAAYDGCIGLNLGITNDATLGTPGGYSLISVIEHEIDEVLGLGSDIQFNGTVLSTGGMTEDLFRYASNGVRSFGANAACPGPGAYFSVNQGATNLDNFTNCNNSGDYGDWVTHTPTQVQDGGTNGSASPFLTATSAETRALDVIGYTLTTQNQSVTPEPSTLPLLATGLTGMAGFGIRRRRKNAAR